MILVKTSQYFVALPMTAIILLVLTDYEKAAKNSVMFSDIFVFK